MITLPNLYLATDAITVIRHALDNGPDFELRNPRVLAAIAQLEQHLPATPLLQKVRQALDMQDVDARWECCSHSLDGLELGVAAMQGGCLPPPR